MISSRKILSLTEKWIKSFNAAPRGLADIYENPSKSDYSELFINANKDRVRKSTFAVIRFFADDKSKTVYVWDGEKAIHAEIARTIGLNDRLDSDPSILSGIATLSSGKAKMVQSDSLESIDKHSTFDTNYYNQVISKDWSWTNRYIDVTTYLSKLKPI